MKISFWQGPFRAADVAHNLNQIEAALYKAIQEKSDLFVLPFMALTGYPVGDYAVDKGFFQAIEKALLRLKVVREMPILLTYPVRYKNDTQVRQILLSKGKETLLALLDLEGKLLTPRCVVVSIAGVKIELIYEASFPKKSTSSEGEVFLLQWVEPFYVGLSEKRQKKAKKFAKEQEKALLAFSALGASGEYLFDGSLWAYNARGKVSFKLASFTGNKPVYWDKKKAIFKGAAIEGKEKINSLRYKALVFSLRAFADAVGFSKVCLGLSGGIDSALVLALAYEAFGGKNCEVLLLPSRYTSDMSNDLALKMARHLQVKHEIVPIEKSFTAIQGAMAQRFTGLAPDVTEENLQSRIRGVLLMALANKTAALLLCTSNKSEEAVGYCTLYGDTNGGFAPIKDLYKTEVYDLARWINKHIDKDRIPTGIIERPPSAELSPNQTDEKALMPYARLDRIIQLIIENQTPEEIISQGFSKDDVEKVMHWVRQSEFKRQQAPLGPKLSERSFGEEWHYPLTRLSKTL